MDINYRKQDFSAQEKFNNESNTTEKTWGENLQKIARMAYLGYVIKRNEQYVILAPSGEILLSEAITLFDVYMRVYCGNAQYKETFDSMVNEIWTTMKFIDIVTHPTEYLEKIHTLKTQINEEFRLGQFKHNNGDFFTCPARSTLAMLSLIEQDEKILS